MFPVGSGSVAEGVNRLGLAFLDGHAARHDYEDLVAPCWGGDGDVPQAFRRIGLFGMHTVQGAMGRDTR